MHKNAYRSGLAPGIKSLEVGQGFTFHSTTSDHSIRAQVCLVQNKTGRRFSVKQSFDPLATMFTVTRIA